MANVFTDEQINEIIEIITSQVGHNKYIGARYVPMFGRKNEDTIEWDNKGTYEPLTIVLNEGNSYTSRQYVPAGVDIRNQAYWANTGNYNAQIEAYRQEVYGMSEKIDKEISDRTQADTALESKIAAETTARTQADTELENKIKAETTARTQADTALGERITEETTSREKSISAVTTLINNEISEREKADTALSEKIGNGTDTVRPNLDFSNIVLIGDSYLRGVGNDDVGWGKYFNDTLAASATVTEFGNSQAGFTVSGVTGAMAGMDYYAMLDYATTKVEADKIDWVVLAGGWNDNGTAADTVKSKTIRCAEHARSLFKKANVFIVALSNERKDLKSGYLNAAIEIVKGAQSAGCKTVPDSFMWLKSDSDISSSDNIHPNDAGYKKIGQYIASAMRGCDPQPINRLGAGATIGEDMTSNTFRNVLINGIVYLQGEFTSSKWSEVPTMAVLPAGMRPARTFYTCAQISGSGFKDVAPVYINTSGTIQIRTPFKGSYPSSSATVYLPMISYPIGIL